MKIKTVPDTVFIFLEARAIISDARVLQLAHVAAGYKTAEWDSHPVDPLHYNPIFNQSRATASIIGDALLYAHSDKNGVGDRFYLAILSRSSMANYAEKLDIFIKFQMTSKGGLCDYWQIFW